MPSSLLHTIASIYYAILVIGHPLDSTNIFYSPALQSVPSWAIAGLKGNFYGTTSWLALAAYMHYSWRSVTAEQVRVDRGRWREIKVASAIMGVNFGCIGVYYFWYHRPLIWLGLAIPAGLEAMVFFTT
ncbi:hypothetical protein MBLNU457_5538t1 [Dothideomycetes sp. NU457]